jgi:hypothetical protein
MHLRQKIHVKRKAIVEGFGFVVGLAGFEPTTFTRKQSFGRSYGFL